jgi:flagellar basal-body rod modification protein FlgD
MNVTNDPIAALAARTSQSANTEGARSRLDQDSFLQLMIAQFRNQDPTKPQDPSVFLGQLAQFSTVSGIQDIQESFGDLSSALRGAQVLDGAVLVGHSILTVRDQVTAGGGVAVGGAIDVPEGVTNVQLTVKDQAGQLVRSIAAPVSQGLVDFAWDGNTDRGTAAPLGNYTIEAVANSNGRNEALPVLFAARVDSVTIDPTNNRLTLNTGNLGAVPLSDVRRVQ